MNLSLRIHVLMLCNFQYHVFYFQSILSVVFILICAIVSIVCLVLKQRNGRDYKPLATDDPDVEQSIKVGKIKPKVRKINGRVTKPGDGVTCQIQINSESTNHNTPYKNVCNDCDQGCTGGEDWVVHYCGFVFSIAGCTVILDLWIFFSF